MANIRFKRGLLANLPSTIQDGSVYITTDERAMYIDVDSTTRIRIGDIIVCANETALQNAPKSQEALYYLTNKNILAKWNGPGDTDFIQINRQSTLSQLIDSFNTTVASLVNNTGVAITQSVSSSTGGSRSTTYNLISLDPTKVHIYADNNEIKFAIADEVYKGQLSAALDAETANKVNLTLTNKKTGTDVDGNAINCTVDTSTIGLVGEGITMTVLQDGSVKLAATGGVRSVSNAFDAQGGFKTSIELPNTTKISQAVTPTIAYGNSGNQSAVFVNGTATLSVYTKAEVDGKISEAGVAYNAMVFKGSVGTNAGATVSALPTTNVSIGDVYKVSSSNSYINDEPTKIGDMFIATAADGATENASGYLDAEDIVWVYIPSGDEDSASYQLVYDSTLNALALKDAGGNVRGKLTSLSNSLVLGGTNRNITISHATVTVNETTGTAISQSGTTPLTFSAVTDITYDSEGHLSGIETTDITVLNTHNRIRTIAASAAKTSAAGDDLEIVKTTQSITDDYTTKTGTSVEIASESLTLSASGERTVIEMTWGAF